MKTEDDTYRKLMQTPFREVLDAHRALNLSTSEQLDAVLKIHHWTKDEYNAALNQYYTDLIGKQIVIQMGTENLCAGLSDLVEKSIYKK
jgi:hypothetical protein